MHSVGEEQEEQHEKEQQDRETEHKEVVAAATSSKKAKWAVTCSPFPAAMPSTDSHQSSEDLLFPVEDIVQYPLPGYVAPASVSFSPDDKLVSYLLSPDCTLSRKIFGFDLDSKQQRLLVSPPNGGVDEANLSNPEKLRRERLRERGLGVTRYEWAKAGCSPHLMVPLPGGIYVQDSYGSELRLRVPSTPWSPIIDPQLSPDGSSVAYVRDEEIYVIPLACGDPKQITFGARGTGKTHGVAEYIAQEEMDRRNGYWWSPDSKMIAFTEVDASGIPLFRIMHQGKSNVGGDAQEDHSYPFAGESNVKVRLGVVSVVGGGGGGGEVSWMDIHCGLGKEDEEYLARVMWLPDNTLTAQIQSRDHTKLRLLKFGIANGLQKTLLKEKSEIWVNVHDCLTPLHKVKGRIGGGFVWASERTGFRHLYLYDDDGCCISPLTEGEWMVEQVAGVDEDAGIIYFTGTLDSPVETHLYSTQLFPSSLHKDNKDDIDGDDDDDDDDGTKKRIFLQKPNKLTRGEGRHLVVLDHQMKRFVDMHDSLTTPPRVLLCCLASGKVIVPIFEQPAPTPRTRKLQLAAPEIVELEAGDGTTLLYGALYKPNVKQFGPPPYRTVVSVYGGPNVQSVCNSWMNTVDMRAQYLRSRGILVWKLDNRGSARRGLKFEGAIKYKMGQVDIEDQERGVEWLIKEGLAMKEKIGIYGWSYGGYLAAMALARCPQMFKCAVAGAPVTAWDGYDTYYSEKYMGFPTSNQSGYQYTSVMYHAHKMMGKLLLVHGMIDENVHFRHTARLINALIAAAKEYDLLVFPDERHMPRGLRDRMYMEERICDFLQHNL